MTSIRIIEDESYPDYYLDARPGAGCVELDVPDDVAVRWRAARTAWDAACSEIYTAYRAIEYPSNPQYRDDNSGNPTYPGRRQP